MKKWFLLWLCFLPMLVFAQAETIVVGQILDAKTGQPLSNVNIVLRGTNIGATSNVEGLFCVRGKIQRSRVMEVSCVGYKTQRFTVQPGQNSGIDVMMVEEISHMMDVFVFPGENPALPLMERVRANRPLNDKTVQVNNTTQSLSLYVSNIRSQQLRRVLWQRLQAGYIPGPDSTYLLPLYARMSNHGEVSERSSIMTNANFQAILDGAERPANFYHNTVDILSASVLSPLASSSSSYYKFYLADSVMVNGQKHYIIHFRTRNPFYATFNGEMEIDSASAALCKIDASMPVENNINYIHDLRIHQIYTSQHELEQEQMSMLMEVAIKADTSHVFPSLFLTRETRVDASVSPSSPLPLAILPKADSTAFAALDSTRLFRLVKFAAYVIQTGYWPTNKKVEIGKLREVLEFNPMECVRIGVPLRTTPLLWKNVSLEGFVAYGVRDRAFKGAGEIHINLPSNHRHQILLRYGDEYVYTDNNEYGRLLRENSTWSPDMSILSRWTMGWKFNSDYYYNFYSRRREGKAVFEDEWNSFLETKSYVKFGLMGLDQPTSDYKGQNSYFYTTVGTILRFSFSERKVDLYFHRKHLYNHLPVIFVGAEVGSYNMSHHSRYRMYGNVNLTIRQDVNLGMAGSLNYALTAGMVFGTVPYSLLQIMPGNQTYTYDPYRFTLMNYYQYAADRYITLQANWNARGLLFNLIPGWRYLRLHELMELKVAWGAQRPDHTSVYEYPILPSQDAYSLLQPLNIPYVEAGVGVGNIFRVGELYSIWRLTRINDPACPYWTLRFRIHFGL